MLKKLCSRLLVVVLCVMSCLPVYAAEQDKEVTTENEMARINPVYDWAWDDGFSVGSDYTQITFFGNVGSGGVRLTSLGYCDFDVTGEAVDVWGLKFPFDTKRDYTSTCEAIGYNITLQQVVEVFAKSKVYSEDGYFCYENRVNRGF